MGKDAFRDFFKDPKFLEDSFKECSRQSFWFLAGFPSRIPFRNCFQDFFNEPFWDSTIEFLNYSSKNSSRDSFGHFLGDFLWHSIRNSSRNLFGDFFRDFSRDFYIDPTWRWGIHFLAGGLCLCCPDKTRGRNFWGLELYWTLLSGCLLTFFLLQILYS